MTTESSSTARLSCTSVPPARRVPSMIDDVRAGLLSPPRWLPPKYFYDETGSLLFEAICDTPEYYPSRTEAALLAEHAGEIICSNWAVAAAARPACCSTRGRRRPGPTGRSTSAPKWLPAAAGR